jgi:predicted dithiol-disulfide oxidoreductase (DUF899 family)
MRTVGRIPPFLRSQRMLTVRLLYTAHPCMGPEIKERGIDLLSPVWNILDLTPRGRSQWYESMAYGNTPEKLKST